jgi:DNA-nicking Smr family endonuclease
LKTNSLNNQENNKDKLRTRRQDQGQQDHSIFFSAGGNSQENFTKNLCWRRIGLTRQENFTEEWRRIGLTQLKTNSLNNQENNKDKLRTRRQDQGQQDHSIFFSAGGNSQENFTKNLCWRRIGLTQLKTN